MNINNIPQIYECPIWGKYHEQKNSLPKKGYNKKESWYEVNSPRAGGTYRITNEAVKKLKGVSKEAMVKNLVKESLDDINFDDVQYTDDALYATNTGFKARLTTWLIQQRKAGNEHPLITIEVLEQVRQKNQLPIQERINNVLGYIHKRNQDHRDKWSHSEDPISVNELKAYSECADDKDWHIILDDLKQNQLVKIYGEEGQGLKITLTVKGLERLESLATNKDSKQAFDKMSASGSKNAKGILIKTIRVANFRGLKNIEVDLESTTILTGVNNTGKTSLLDAFKLVFGDSRFLSQDDFFMNKDHKSEKITIDILIIPVDQEGQRCGKFSTDWMNLFTEDRVRFDKDKSYVPLRTTITFDPNTNDFKREKFSMAGWPDFQSNNSHWFDKENDGNKRNFNFDEIPFFDVDAQRDILKDIKSKKSYLGRMLSKIDYSQDDIKTIEAQIKSLNDKAVKSSPVLSEITTTLKELGSTIGTSNNNIEITPFTKKIHDLNKGLSIYYSDRKDSFSMEYHGMGTRSWSSLLTLKALISLLAQHAKKEQAVFFPILIIEEPEAHLHPNAQKQLYHQINTIKGQKIISTHSTYIPMIAPIKQIRGLYKKDQVSCGKLDILSDDATMKIKRKIINTRGEIFFSKFIVFFEGETERHALPILAKKYFDKEPFEIGLDFIDVGGHGGYLPFLQFAKAFHIPWIIFSDAEEKTIKSVRSQISQTKNQDDQVIFLDEGKNFEKQLIADGFTDEIKKALISLTDYKDKQHKTNKEQEIKNYNSKQLYDNMIKDKVKIGRAVADEIVKSNKDLPPKIKELFNKINNDLKIKDIDNGNFS